MKLQTIQVGQTPKQPAHPGDPKQANAGSQTFTPGPVDVPIIERHGRCSQKSWIWIIIIIHDI
jgi:hypothetical protein